MKRYGKQNIGREKNDADKTNVPSTSNHSAYSNTSRERQEQRAFRSLEERRKKKQQTRNHNNKLYSTTTHRTQDSNIKRNAYEEKDSIRRNFSCFVCERRKRRVLLLEKAGKKRGANTFTSSSSSPSSSPPSSFHFRPSLIRSNLSCKRVANSSLFTPLAPFASLLADVQGGATFFTDHLLISLFFHVLLPPIALLLYCATRFAKQKQRRRNDSCVSGRRHLKYIFLFHFLSFLLGCVYCTASSTVAAMLNTTPIYQSKTDFGDTGGVEFAQNNMQTSEATNPFLIHQRRPSRSEQVCHIWSSHSPEALCAKGRWARLRLLREILLFSRDCDMPFANIYLGELFRLDWHVIKTEADLVAHTEHLRPGVEGRDCILSSTHSAKCYACFARVNAAMTQLESAYTAFEHTLKRFDCLLAVDSSSATRPFSPNGTCIDCKIWYRKWLLVELLQVWRDPPCINWCFYTQLACPHFGTSKVVDFAGHPAFMCRDLSIPQTNTGLVSNEKKRNSDKDGINTCKCVHPCDLQRDFQPYASKPSAPQLYFTNNDQPYDFYASIEHCWARRKRCRNMQTESLKDEGKSRAQAAKFSMATNHFREEVKSDTSSSKISSKLAHDLP